METSALMAILSSALGLASAVATKPWPMRRWLLIASKELALHSTMRDDADNVREFVTASLLKADAYERVLRGLGYTLDGGTPVKMRRPLVSGVAKAYVVSFAMNVAISIAANGLKFTNLRTIAIASVASSVIYVVTYALTAAFPNFPLNPYRGRDELRRKRDIAYGKTLVAEAKATILEREAKELVKEADGGSLPGPSIRARLDDIKSSLKELYEEIEGIDPDYL